MPVRTVGPGPTRVPGDCSRRLQLVPSVQRETFPGLQEAVVPAGRAPGVLVLPLRAQCPPWRQQSRAGRALCAVSSQSSQFRKQLLSVF